MKRWFLATLAILVLAPALAAAFLLRSVDASLVRDRILQEAQRATGRQIAATEIHVSLFPDLTLVAQNVALANPPGFSRPAMLTARKLVLRIALIPLLAHRVIVRDIALQDADLRLEQPPGLPPNWIFSPHRHSARLAHAMPEPNVRPMQIRTLTVLAIDADGAVAWRTPLATGQAALQQVALREVNASSTISLLLRATIAQAPLTLAGKFGGQSHLWNQADTAPWPVDLRLDDASGTLSVNGTVTHPRTLGGYDLAVAAHGPELWRLLDGWPDLRPVPHLRDVVLRTRLIDQNGALDMPALTLAAGPSDLSATAPGLFLTRLAIGAPNIDGTAGTQANHLDADGRFAGGALSLHAVLGPVGRLFGRGQVAASTPIVLDANAQAAGATIDMRGKVQPRGDWSGTDAAIHAHIPDLAALDPLLAPIVHHAMPPLRAIDLDAALRSAGGVLTLGNFHAVLPQADLTLTGAARLGAHPRLEAALHIARLDADTQAAAAQVATALAALPAMLPVPGVAPKPAAAAKPPAPPAAPPSILARADAVVSVTGDGIAWHGVPIASVAVLARLHHGLLDVDPASLTIAGQPVQATLIARLGASGPPALAATLHAQALDAATIATLAGSPGAATGTLTLNAGLAAAGATPRAMLASLQGTAGIALAAGSIARPVLIAGLAHFTPVARLDLPLGAGPARIACLAGGFDLARGVATPHDLLLDTPRFRVAAAGTIDLADQTLDLTLRPWFALGGAGLVVPGTATGSWTNPVLRSLPPGAPQSPALLIADRGDCAAALAAAAEVASPAVPNLAQASPPPPNRSERALDLLKRLFGGAT
jgi:AsmA protein